MAMKKGQGNIKKRKVIGGTKTRSTNATGDTKYVQTTRQIGRTKISRTKKVPQGGKRMVKTTVKRTAPKRR